MAEADRAAVRLPVPDAPDGYEQVAVTSSLNWRLVSGKRCRRPRCPNPAVAELNRGAYCASGRRDNWWAYCETHVGDYRSWVEDGQVMHWALREVEADG